MEQIIAQVIGGALGGVGGGRVVKGADMGSLGNILTGAIGGLGGGQLLGWLMGGATDAAAAAGGMDITALASNFVGGGVGGLVVQVIVGFVVKKMRA